MGARLVKKQVIDILGKGYKFETIDHGLNLEQPGIETHLVENENMSTRGSNYSNFAVLAFRNNEYNAQFDAALAYIKALFPHKETRTREPGETSTIGTNYGLSRDGYLLLNVADTYITQEFFDRWNHVWCYSVLAEMAAAKGIDFTVCPNERTDELVYNKRLNRIEFSDRNLDETIDYTYMIDAMEKLLSEIE
jgi:hypothetical protein